jgi:prepilin-type N-terminal cleavage/methylation domain-containing protein
MRRAARRTVPGRSQAAMTLVELMIVIVIVAIFGTASLPSFQVDDSVRMRLVELQASNAIDYAAHLAERTGAPHGVVFDTASDGFAVVDRRGVPVRDLLGQEAYVVSFDRPGQPKGIDFTAASFGDDGPVAIFGADGLPEHGGAVTVSCQGLITTLALNAATGRFQAR